MTNEIIEGDCLEVMKRFPDNHFSAIVTDPPYGLHFMGKDWDKFKYQFRSGTDQPTRIDQPGRIRNSGGFQAGEYDPERDDEFQSFIRQVAIEAFRIVKPGGHVLMFGSPRRHHRQMAALEDAGWEIRDCLMWLFGSGFPKSHNHFGIEGYGTALKPAYEPIILAMRPLDGTFKQNAEKWGQAGINIDGCRIATCELKDYSPGIHKGLINDDGWKGVEQIKKAPKGRWPANVILDEEAARLLDQQSGICKPPGNKKSSIGTRIFQSDIATRNIPGQNCYPGESGGASRFFYCAKASSRERNEGLDDFPLLKNDFQRETSGLSKSTKYRNSDEPQEIKSGQPKANHHPTVKPLKLMEYLIRLVMPPKDGLLLDPFAGSGSTILAAKRLGFSAIGIEKSAEYCAIARARIAFEKVGSESSNSQLEFNLGAVNEA